MNQPLRFHWSLSQAGNKFRRASDMEGMSGLIDTAPQVALCKKAEENGIESMLMAIGFTRPDPLLLTVHLAQQTKKIKFMVAVRSGIISPSFFVQQINTAAALTNGRILINVVGGHSPVELGYYGDFTAHDERYERSGEFLEICNKFWNEDSGFDYKGKFYQLEKATINTPFIAPDRNRPEIYVGGNSRKAANLAAQHADCLWRFPDTMQSLQPVIDSVLHRGKEVGLLVSLITRPSQEQAVEEAYGMLKEMNATAIEANEKFRKKSDSEGFKAVLEMAAKAKTDWKDSCLWTGAVPYLGAPSIALVGSYENIAKQLMAYKKIGISQFLFMGWPDIEEVEHFGKGVLPLLRKMENHKQKENVLN
ncbi:MAG: alkanesulfonate monooxygenase [Saprospiraceae bacterium]|jgi:alkanesulfonate monooxygenase